MNTLSCFLSAPPPTPSSCTPGTGDPVVHWRLSNPLPFPAMKVIDEKGWEMSVKPLVSALVHTTCFLCLLSRVSGQAAQMTLPENVTFLSEIRPSPGSGNGTPSLTPLSRVASLSCLRANPHLVAFSENRPVSPQSVAGPRGPFLCVDTLGGGRQRGQSVTLASGRGRAASSAQMVARAAAMGSSLCYPCCPPSPSGL